MIGSAGIVVALGTAVDPGIVIGRKEADRPMIGERTEGLTELIGITSSQRVIGEEIGKPGEIVGEEQHAGQGVRVNVGRVRIMAGGTSNADGTRLMTAGQWGVFQERLADGSGSRFCPSRLSRLPASRKRRSCGRRLRAHALPITRRRSEALTEAARRTPSVLARSARKRSRQDPNAAGVFSDATRRSL